MDSSQADRVSINQLERQQLDEELKAAFVRFTRNGPKLDPGSKAKLAALTALDFLESLDAEPFVTAVRLVQKELTQGDTGAVVRARAVLGLARLQHPDFMLHAAERLADREPSVREAAADALGHRGDPAGAGLLELRLRIGERDPSVLLAVLSAMIALAPNWGVNRAAGLLGGRLDADGGEDDDWGSRDASDAAALALGQSHRDDALGLLVDALGAEVRAVSRATLLRAIGAHRSERAVEVLLRTVAEGDGGDAGVAVEALLARRADPDLLERTRVAVEQNPNARLTDRIRAALEGRAGER
jgi:HEAT repeat protein